MYSKTIWQKRFAKALACGCLLVASAYPAASAAPAMLALGHLYEEGLGTTRDLDMARSWYEKAEAAGDGQAPAALARLAAEDTREAAALSGTNETSTLSEESGRKITTRVSPGSALDIQDGVTKIDTSAIWTPVTAIDFSSHHDTMIENADGSQVPMDQPYFTSEQIAPDTWKIQNDGDYCYLLAGDELAVMIDCGYGAGNIRAYAQTLTDKPVKYVINTHYHFDHTANDAYFDAAFMTKESIPYATVPYDSFKGIDFSRDYPVITVQDGYKLNLGNRELTILTVPHPNHAIGDIAILDLTRRILYTGDELLLAGRADLNISLQDFAENMQHLNSVRQDFDQLYTGTGEKSGEVFDHYYAAAMYGISPDFHSEPVTESAGRRPNEKQTTADGKTLYQRGRVRPGDETKNAPEIIPTGQRMSYTVDSFPVTYIATTSTSSN